jgi:hypothetical protein
MIVIEGTAYMYTELGKPLVTFLKIFENGSHFYLDVLYNKPTLLSAVMTS